MMMRQKTFALGRSTNGEPAGKKADQTKSVVHARLALPRRCRCVLPGALPAVLQGARVFHRH